MIKKALFLILLCTGLISSGQDIKNTRNSFFIIEVNGGVGHYNWKPDVLKDVGNTSGTSFTGNLKMMYQYKKLNTGLGLGYDRFQGTHITNFYKTTLFAGFNLTNGKITTGPSFGFGVAWFDNSTFKEKYRWGFLFNAGWFADFYLNDLWSFVLKPSYEIKWPRQIISNENISLFTIQVGIKHKLII